MCDVLLYAKNSLLFVFIGINLFYCYRNDSFVDELPKNDATDSVVLQERERDSGGKNVERRVYVGASWLGGKNLNQTKCDKWQAA